jgi:heme A synthase
LISLYVIVISGSIVVSAGAQSACPSWPICGRSSSQFGVVVIQMVHRSVVLVGSMLVVAFLVSLLRRAHSSRSERTLARIGLGLFALQVTAGAMSAVWSAHTEIADVHLAVASVLWSCVVAAFTLSTLERSTDGAGYMRSRLEQRI